MDQATTHQSVNPFDNKLVKSFEDITDAQLEQKMATATACFGSWKRTSYAHRAEIIAQAAKLLHEQAEHFAQIMTMEMGKRITEARGEVEFSSQILAYYAETAERFLAPVKLHPRAGEANMESSPIGVIFGVKLWSFPYYQLARVAGPHLMAGNTLVIKHAGCVPHAPSPSRSCSSMPAPRLGCTPNCRSRTPSPITSSTTRGSRASR